MIRTLGRIWVPSRASFEKRPVNRFGRVNRRRPGAGILQVAWPFETQTVVSFELTTAHSLCFANEIVKIGNYLLRWFSPRNKVFPALLSRIEMATFFEDTMHRYFLSFVLLLILPIRSFSDEAICVLGSQPELLQERGAGEGPAWHPDLGLLTSGEGNINLRDKSGKLSVYRAKAGSNGLMFDRQGRLVICESAQKRITRLEKDGTLTVLADSYDGKHFNQPNDLTMDSKDRIYFSDPCYGDRSQMELADASGRKIEGVYRIDPDGKVTRIITHEVDRPNGLVVTADDKFLFVADNNNNSLTGARKLWRFDLKPDGTVDFTSQKLIHDWQTTRGPDGLKLDSVGRLFVAAGLNRPNPPYEAATRATAGVYVFSPEGKLLQFIPIPRDETTNCAFGGDDLKTLFVTAGGSLWSIRMKTPGKPVFPKSP
jgi:gluconolactonase